MNKFIPIKEAALHLGISPQTLRRWEREGKIPSPIRTKGGQRRYALSTLTPSETSFKPNSSPTIAYARVSSHDQKEDLQRQEKMLEMYCYSHGWVFEVIKDLGSGMNYHKKGLKKLLNLIVKGDVGRIVLTHKDRLLRFGSELIFSLCAIKNIEVVILNQGEDSSFEEDLAKDVLEIITVFSARLYGSRSHKNKTLMKDLETAAKKSLCSQVV